MEFFERRSVPSSSSHEQDRDFGVLAEVEPASDVLPAAAKLRICEQGTLPRATHVSVKNSQPGAGQTSDPARNSGTHGACPDQTFNDSSSMARRGVIRRMLRASRRSWRSLGNCSAATMPPTESRLVVADRVGN